MAKKKDEEPIKPQPAPNAGDAVASGLFGGSLFQPNFLQRIGSSFSDAVSRGIAQPPPPAMMVGSAGVNPLVASNIPSLPSMGPLIRTSRFNSPESSPAATQPERQPYNYGLYAATMGLPSFDVTKTQTPFDQYSSATPQQLSNLVANRAAPQQAQVPTQDLIFPLPADQRSQGRTPINIQGMEPMSQRSATLYATPEQLTNFASRQTAYEGRTPEQQAALLANIRSRGPALAQQRIQGQEQFFSQKRAERAALAGATVEAYKSGASPQSIREARAAYESQQPSSVAGIQRQYTAMAPNFNRPMAERTAFVREPFGIPSGGPQPSTGLANSFPLIEDRNRNPFGSIYGFGA